MLNYMGMLSKTHYSLYILILLASILIQLGQYAYAISGYDSGRTHGCSDMPSIIWI